MDVGLDVAKAQIDGSLKGGEGVFRPQDRAAPMGQTEGVLVGEIGPHGTTTSPSLSTFQISGVAGR